MTVQNLIDAALRSIGVLAAGESPSTEESNDGLTALNHLVSSWNAQALPVYQLTRNSFTLTGAASYSIGTGQTFNAARPVKIESASYTANGITVPLQVVNNEKWAEGTLNRVLFYDHGYPNGNIYLRPSPSAGSLEIYSYQPIAQFSALSDSVTFPDGYERALRFGLAVDLAPEFGRPVTPELVAVAQDAKTSVFGLNQAILGSPSPVDPPAAQAA